MGRQYSGGVFVKTTGVRNLLPGMYMCNKKPGMVYNSFLMISNIILNNARPVILHYKCYWFVQSPVP